MTPVNVAAPAHPQTPPPRPAAPVATGVVAGAARDILFLNYAARPERRGRWPGMRVALFILSLPALVTPFLSFTWGTSPLDVIEDVPGWNSEWPLYLLALTFFASFPILLWKARRLAWATPPGRWETRALAVVALIVTVPAVMVVGRMLWEVRQTMRAGNMRGDETVMLSLAVVVLAGGLILSAWRWRRRGLLFGIETSLVVGYVTVAGM